MSVLVTYNDRYVKEHPHMFRGLLLPVRWHVTLLATDYAPWWAWPFYKAANGFRSARYRLYWGLWHLGLFEVFEAEVITWRNFDPAPWRGRKRSIAASSFESIKQRELKARTDGFATGWHAAFDEIKKEIHR